MKQSLLLMLWLTMTVVANAQVFPVETIVNNGVDAKRVKYVFLSDGYQAGELNTFITQATAVKTFIFTQPPYQQYQNFFNFYAIRVPSMQSGADHPANAGDEASSPPQPVLVADTYFNSTFDAFGIHRLVVPQNGTAINNVLTANFPTYNQVVVLVNSNYYGGSGGTYATNTVDPSANEVAIHEIGHSFANLADEYEIDGQGEKANRTTNTNPATVKWKNWLGYNNGTGAIGIYNIGVAGGWQRPHQNCKMRYLGVPFCAVCKEAFINKIYSLVTPIYEYLPASSMLTVSATTNFSATLTLPIPNTLTTEWKLNGTSLGAGTSTGGGTGVNINITPGQLNVGANTLTLFVTDGTTLSRSYLPGTGYVFSQSWTLAPPLPLEMLSFEATKEKGDVLLNWRTANEVATSHFDVQRSFDGRTFSKIGQVQTNNKSINQYDFTDRSVPAGTLYYRLQQFDLDGKSTFSPIRTIEKSDKFYYEMSPNPTTDFLTIKGNADYAMELVIEAFSENGARVYQQQISVEGAYQHTIDMARLASGMYTVTLRLPNGFVVNEQIVKTK